jgi:serine/threonine protein kinase
VVAPAYPSNFYFSKSNPTAFFAGQEKQGAWFVKSKSRTILKTQAPAELGDLRSNVALVIRLARAVRRMHAAGLAHSDLSYKNVLVDPMTGSAQIIDIDSLVVRGLFAPTVMGTPGFIAPEVLSTAHLSLNDPNRVSPSIQTDRHALASLIYQYLLLRDPLDGPKIHDLDPDRDENLKWGSKALFVENPVDQSNRPKALGVPMSALGPMLEPLFLQTFVKGLHDPGDRVLAAEWERALVDTFNLLVPCAKPTCEARYFPVWKSSKVVCPFCGTRYPVAVPVLALMRQSRPGMWTADAQLAGYRGCSLLTSHVYSNAPTGEAATDKDRVALATIDFVQGQWVLVNNGLTSLISSNGNRVMPGTATPLTPGARLQLSQEPNGRLAEVSFVNP